jgi:scyllo-inositol 2-dehydrogenase (NADP+)
MKNPTISSSHSRFARAKDIKVGVIGYGGAYNMGRAHLQQMQKAGMTPVAVAEIDPLRLQAATVDFPGIQTYQSVSEMLRKSDVNLVVIITPHNTHASLALQCLRAGRHVVCEKPLAITTAEVDRMIAAASKSGVMLSTYHNRHWDGRILQAVEQIKKKKVIGEVIRVECHIGLYERMRDWWRSSKTISGGILYDWGVHLLEYSLQLIDSEITEVSGFAHHGYWAKQSRWKKDTIEDEGFAVVRFANGQWLTLCISQIDSKPREGLVTITGTQGTYLIDGAHSKILTVDDSGKIRNTQQLPNPEDQGQCYYNNVRSHLTRGTPLTITAEWSRRPIHILDLAVQSARKGHSLRAKYP